MPFHDSFNMRKRRILAPPMKGPPAAMMGHTAPATNTKRYQENQVMSVPPETTGFEPIGSNTAPVLKVIKRSKSCDADDFRDELSS